MEEKRKEALKMAGLIILLVVWMLFLVGCTDFTQGGW